MLVLAFGAGLTGMTAAEAVEVAAVRFTNLRAPDASNDNWFEADVALNVKPPPGAVGQMVSRVRVTLLLGFDVSPAVVVGERQIEYYRAEAECVALESGRANVRFYLPPELVKRDQLHGDPKYWGIELAVGGRALPAARAAYVNTLAATDLRKNFQTRGGAAAAGNDGLLQPQYFTPFAFEYPRATPTFVRREVR